MIPVRLELKNFMSYGEQVTPLDFRGIRLACLAGDNGNGKSALLDAITWALWGEARASSDELIRLGAEEMRVTFDFEVGGDLYRVIRCKSKRNSGNVWEVYIQESGGRGAGDSNERAPDGTSSAPQFRPLTGQGIRDTGRVIQRILRMDYKTFVNSAYIQQGRADEFTKQTVADRKKILADILDLSRYDVLEQRAKDCRNEAEQRVQDLGRDIARMEEELANEDGHKARLVETAAERDSLEAGISETEGRLRDLQARQTELEAAARRVGEMERSLRSWREELERLRSQEAEQERRVVAGGEMLKDRERIISGREKLQSARERATMLDRRLEELRALEHEKSRLDQQVLMEKHKIELEWGSLSKELSELESKIDGAARLSKDAELLRAHVAGLDKLDARRTELQSEVAAHSDRWGALKAEYERLVVSKPELEEKLKMISEPGAKCPLCRTELGHDKHEGIIADYKQQIEKTDRRIKELLKEGSEAKNRRDAAQKESDEIGAQLKDGLEVRRRLAQAEQLLFQIEEYRKQAPAVRERLGALGRKLESNDFAQEVRSSLKCIGERIAFLEYDADEHGHVKEELASLAEFESLAVKLKHAEENLPADEANLKAIRELIGAREKSISECETSIRELGSTLEELPAITSELAAVSGTLASLRESHHQVIGRIATLEHALERCKALRAEVSEKRKALETAKKDKEAYTELVAAFGKKGVQALIIENAVPEIQEEANRLLARMTDNAMQVSIQTVRDKKTGGTAETLDIRISDDIGTRSYDLYSGGEAFRVNFALRIAISKLLAGRAGARLQTLIIDEGFGTQDAKGREKLVEAIDSIRDDFDLILVITHIDELKDVFPTRIEITKDSLGSRISLN